MKFCAVVGCGHRSNRDKDFKFFRFPSIQTRQRKIVPAREERRASRIAALHREDFTESKAKNYFVCSAHFITGQPSDDPEHPDYVPSQNMGYKTNSGELQMSRIHVERVIGVLRQKYTILHETLPISLVKKKEQNDIPTLDKIMVVCCALVNMCPSVVSLE